MDEFDLDPELDFGPQGELWTDTLNERPAKMQFQYRELRGVLCLLKSEDFTTYQDRFKEISPTSMPRLIDGEACEPWTLLNPLLGKTW